MYIKFIFLLLMTTALIARPSLGGIIETEDVNDIAELLDSDTLVVIEVEDTLFKPLQILGSEMWADYVVRDRGTEGLDLIEARAELTPLWNQILQKTEVKWIDPSLQGLIRSLQRNHQRVMGIAWKDADLALTYNQHLATVDVQLAKTAPFRGTLLVGPSIRMVDGVLYVGVLNSPGAALIQTLDTCQQCPARLVVVSHKMDRIEEILFAAKQRGIPAFGVRFSSADRHLKEFKPEIATLQMQYFKKIISDEAAATLLPSTFSWLFGSW